MEKLVVVIMGQDCEEFIGMCLESVKDADDIVYCDGGSVDGTQEIVSKFFEKEYNGIPWIIENNYNQEDKAMNGKQRNFYLDCLKKENIGEWCLVLDADEVLEDFGIQKIKQIISQIKHPMILSPRMHHFVGDLGHEDFTQDQHWVLNRLFKITEDLYYPETEHPVLQGNASTGKVDVHIWHLRECLGVFNTQKKHEWNTNKSQMHNKAYLDWWHKSMLFGNYPRKRVYYGNIPFPIKQKFGI